MGKQVRAYGKKQGLNPWHHAQPLPKLVTGAPGRENRLTLTYQIKEIMQKKPLVSIYIPTFNRIELLKRAIDSVLHQDYSEIEIIIVDDGSVDGTVEYLKELATKDSRVSYILNTENSGACISRNKAIKAAAGELITGLDDDDYFLPQRVSSLVKAWQGKEKDTIAICSNSLTLEKNGLLKKTRKPRKIKQADLIDSNLIGNQILTETKNLLNLSGFDESLPAWQDLDLWYRLLAFKNSQVECVKSASYVVDVSHPHERISTGRIEKIRSTCDYFSKKHGLSQVESSIIYLQTFWYTTAPPPLSHIIHKILRRPTPRNLWQAAKLSTRYLR